MSLIELEMALGAPVLELVRIRHRTHPRGAGNDLVKLRRDNPHNRKILYGEAVNLNASGRAALGLHADYYAVFAVEGDKRGRVDFYGELLSASAADLAAAEG